MEEDAEYTWSNVPNAEPSSEHMALSLPSCHQGATKASDFANVGMASSEDQHGGNAGLSSGCVASSRGKHGTPGPSCRHCLAPALLMSLLLVCAALQSMLIFLRISGARDHGFITGNFSDLQRSLTEENLRILLQLLINDNQTHIGRSPGCPNLWIAANDKCYFLSETQKSHSDSGKDCAERGSGLALVKEEETIQRLVTMTGKEFWVGLIQHNIHGAVWAGRWADGSAENVTGGIGSCAKLGARLVWENCYTKLHWICERDTV